MEDKDKVHIAKRWLILMFLLVIVSGISFGFLVPQLSVAGKLIWVICSFAIPFIIVKIIIPKAIKSKK